MRILGEECCFLLIDVQERLFPHIHNNAKLKENLIRLIKGLKILQIPTIVTQQYTKGLGATIPDIANELEPFESIEKMCFSCLDNDSVSEILKDTNRKYVIIAGIESHVCVLQTVIDLLASSYTPVVIANCISSRNSYDKEIAIKRMESEGAILATYESILLELTRFADLLTFKSISKVIK